MLAVRAGHLAAQSRRRHDLAGVGQPGRVERAAQALERVQVLLAEHLRHVLLLVDPDAVLAGDRPAGVQAGVEDEPGELLGALGFALHAAVVADERVQVAVAGVEDVATMRSYSAASSSIRASTSGSLVRGITPSWTK